MVRVSEAGREGEAPVNVNVKNGVKSALAVPLWLVVSMRGTYIQRYQTYSCHVPYNGCVGSGSA